LCRKLSAVMFVHRVINGYNQPRMYENILIDSGLTDKQATVYGVLISTGDLSAQDIVSLTKLKRATVYDTLKSLSKEGLVTTFIKDKKTYFHPEHPYSVREVALKRKNSVDHGLNQLESSMNDLVSEYMTSTHTPGVLVFEGREEVKKVYEDLLQEGKEILSIVQPANIDPPLYKWLTTTFVKKRVSKKIPARVVVAGASNEATVYSELDKKELRGSRTIEDPLFQVGIEFMVYGNKVAYVSFSKNADIMGIIIQNQFIASAMKSVWQIVWRSANGK